MLYCSCAVNSVKTGVSNSLCQLVFKTFSAFLAKRGCRASLPFVASIAFRSSEKGVFFRSGKVANESFRTSVSEPITAAAAAIAGEHR